MQQANWDAAHRREGKCQLVGVGDWAEPLKELCPGKAPLTLSFGLCSKHFTHCELCSLFCQMTSLT